MKRKNPEIDQKLSSRCMYMRSKFSYVLSFLMSQYSGSAKKIGYTISLNVVLSSNGTNAFRNLFIVQLDLFGKKKLQKCL